jgi:ribosome-binding factor A
MAHGAERLAQELKMRIGEILLLEVRDPRVGFATVTSARLSPDHRQAKIYVSVLGSSEDVKRTLEALNKASGYIRRQLSSKMRLRHSPELTFAFDPSVETGARMEEILEEVKKETAGFSPETPSESASEGLVDGASGRSQKSEDDQSAEPHAHSEREAGAS